MKIFIYKLLISLTAFYILFELTIGSRIDYFTDMVNSIRDIDQRVILKEKLKQHERIWYSQEHLIDSLFELNDNKI